MVPMNLDTRYFSSLAFLHLIEDCCAGALLINMADYLSVEKTFGLEVRNDVFCALVHEVRVNCVFLIDRNKFLLRSSPDMRSRDLYCNLRSGGHVKSHVGAIGFRIVSR